MRIDVDLTDAPFILGANTIAASAYDSGDLIESAVSEITCPVTPVESRLVGKAHSLSGSAPHFFAVIVGTSSYANPDLNLEFPAGDAQGIFNAVRMGAERLYGSQNISLFLLSSPAASERAQATKANIRAAFEDIRKHSKPSDVLLVYFSGHGISSSSFRDAYYYLTTDARNLEIDHDQKLRDVSTVSSGELRAWLSAATMPLKEVVILDTCAAGAALGSLLKLANRKDVPPDQRRAIELLKDSTGSFVLMGSAADTVSYEASSFGQGLLTYTLLQGMRGASLDAGSTLNVSRWFQFAAEQVPEMAQSIGGIQRPVIAAPKGIGYPILQLSTEDRSRIRLNSARVQLLRVTCLDDQDLDHLNLGELIRQRLREISHPSAPSDTGSVPPIVYLDAVQDGFPGALQPQLRYEVATNKITLHIRMLRNGQRISEQTIQEVLSDKAAIAEDITKSIIAMAKVE